MCGFDLKLKILNKKVNVTSNVAATNSELLHTFYPQINLGIAVRDMKRKVEE